MRSKESLKAEIRELMKAIVESSWNLRKMQRMGNIREVANLLLARTEIYKSIAHRQRMLIEVLEVEAEYGTKEAA